MRDKFMPAVLTIRMTAFELTALHALGAKLGLEPGEIVRTAIRVYFAKHFPEHED